MGGKIDWLSYGLPIERGEDIVLVIDRLERHVPVCGLTAASGEAKRRAQELGADFCVVVNEAGIVLGLVGEEKWKVADTTPVAEIMDPGPSTIRPSVSLEEAAEMLRTQKMKSMLVTSSDGKLMGVFKLERKQQAKNHDSQTKERLASHG
jgi:CBS domain-containing protein